jgi:hypothetical protein
MVRTPVRTRATTLPGQRRPRSGPSHSPEREIRRPLRFWYVPLLLAVVMPLLLWAGLNGAVVVLANRDVGTAAAPVVAPAPAPDQALLDAAIGLVQNASCLPAQSAIQGQPAYAGATWTAYRSEADSHAYFVAAADPTTEHLLGIWQVEGGQVTRLQDNRCAGLPAGTPVRLAEAAVLLSPHRLGAATGR